MAVVCASTNADFGIIEGTVLAAADGNTKLSHLSLSNKVKKGDMMVTSGNSGLFPKGYAVGTVKEMGVETSGLSACAEIEPCSDITRLSTVFVITDFNGKEERADADTNLP